MSFGCDRSGSSSPSPASELLSYDDLAPSAWVNVSKFTQLKTAQLRELSGLARSYFFPGEFWAVNDGGNASALYRINAVGAVTARIEIPKKNRDWEDLASFSWRGKGYVVIADVGDNTSSRAEVKLLVFPEPTTELAPLDSTDQIVRSKVNSSDLFELSFTYPDGPRDCEAMVFSPQERAFFLLTKRDVPPRLYRLEFNPDMVFGERRSGSAAELYAGPTTATFVTEVETLAQPSFSDLKLRHGLFSSQPTAMDIHPDGSGVLVQTYKNAYWYPLGAGWSSSFSVPPYLLTLPRLEQAEAIALSLSGRSVLVGSEGRKNQLLIADEGRK